MIGITILLWPKKVVEDVLFPPPPPPLPFLSLSLCGGVGCVCFGCGFESWLSRFTFFFLLLLKLTTQSRFMATGCARHQCLMQHHRVWLSSYTDRCRHCQLMQESDCRGHWVESWGRGRKDSCCPKLPAALVSDRIIPVMTSGIVSLFPHLLGSRFTPAPLETTRH